MFVRVPQSPEIVRSMLHLVTSFLSYISPWFQVFLRLLTAQLEQTLRTQGQMAI